MTPASNPYDAILVVSFGGPDKPEDVIPFLENVLRGRNVPRERLLEVAEHYQRFGGRSPINDQVRALMAALRVELDSQGIPLPLYWGNRNWHPFLVDTLRQMSVNGVRRALAFVTSAFSSYSSCRQYREDIFRAREEAGPEAPVVDKIRVFYNHPGFLEAVAEQTMASVEKIPAERRAAAQVIFTAHSIPKSMAETSEYEAQLHEACRLVSDLVQHPRWLLAYQSRSGPPQQPWLEPDVNDCLREIHARGELRDVVLVPIGFLSDHMEIIYDLDTAAKAVCEELGLNMVRAATVGTHPRFITMIRELIVERLSPGQERRTLGKRAPAPDTCAMDCCPPPARARPA